MNIDAGASSIVIRWAKKSLYLVRMTLQLFVRPGGGVIVVVGRGDWGLSGNGDAGFN
jgi:hypothetical protein